MLAARAVATGSLALILAACGGGGGGGGNDAQPLPASGSSASSSSSSSISSSSSSSSADNAASSSASSGSSSQGSAEAGSTTLTGNDFEGIWEDSTGAPALITPDGSIYQKGSEVNLTGSISFTTDAWQLGSQTTDWTLLGQNSASGSGSFSPKKSFSGTVRSTGNGSPRDIAVSWTYSGNNNRAVSLASLAGTWLDITIDAAGNISGFYTDSPSTPNSCEYSGKIESVTPGSSKNLFKFSLTRSSVAGKTCNSTVNAIGLAAVMQDMENASRQQLVGVGNHVSTGSRAIYFSWPRIK